jgi:L-fuculose-phosphate aldolase
MSSEASLRADIVEVGRRMYARAYGIQRRQHQRPPRIRSAAHDPKSVCKGFMTPEMMCVTDLEGPKLQGDRDPSSEMLMHLEVYPAAAGRAGRGPRASPTATGFAVAGIPLDRAVLAEVLTTLGSIRSPSATPSCRRLPKPFANNQGARRDALPPTTARSPSAAIYHGAIYRMETIEHFAHISLVARMLGRENLLSREEVMRLQGSAARATSSRRPPICAEPGEAGPIASATAGDDATCQVVRRRAAWRPAKSRR